MKDEELLPNTSNQVMLRVDKENNEKPISGDDIITFPTEWYLFAVLIDVMIFNCNEQLKNWNCHLLVRPFMR